LLNKVCIEDKKKLDNFLKLNQMGAQEQEAKQLHQEKTEQIACHIGLIWTT
jgi:hypothetical protein